MNARLALGGVLLLSLVAYPAGAFAQGGEEISRGEEMLKSVQQGETSCADLTAADFELIGESWMGRMFAAPQAHGGMDRMMASMMGSAGKEQMHEYMGRRVSDCGGGNVPANFDRMMSGVGGMVGMMAAVGGGPGSAGMMDGGYGSMMGGGDDDNHVSGWGVAAVILLVVVLIGAIFFIFRAPRAGMAARTTPTQILQHRFAAGEITRADYERRLRTLGGKR